jgi:hypothetical protein
VAPERTHDSGEEDIDTCRDALPLAHPAAALAREPGKRPLGLDAWDGPCHRTPMPLASLPDPCGKLGAAPAWPESLADIIWPQPPSRSQAPGAMCALRPRCSSGHAGQRAASVSRWMKSPWQVPPRATSSPLSVPGGTCASHRAVVPGKLTACISHPEPTRWHGAQDAIRLPAPPPSLRGMRGGLWGGGWADPPSGNR